MATRADILSDVDTLIGNDAHLSDAEINTVIQLRYEQLWDSFTWSRKLRDFTITLVPQLDSTSTTLATATNGDATVTFAGTPITASYDDTWIQIGSEKQYFHINRTSSAEIELEDGEGTGVNWPGTTAGSLTWRAFKTVYTLPTTADSLLSLAGGDFEVEELSGGRSRLDEMDPNRETTGDHPTCWVYAGVNSSNVREIEVWPVPTQARILRGQFGRTAQTLASGTAIDIPRGLLAYATAADCLNMLHAKTGDVAYSTLALFYESKAKNIEREIKPIELERLSPPTSIRRRPSPVGRFKGTDFEVSHDVDAMGLY